MCWSTARCVLRLSDEEFYAITPRQYSLLLRRHEELVKHQEVQTGILAATFANYTANWSMAPPKRGLQLQPADFMPSVLTERAARQPRRRRRKSDFNDRARAFLAQIKAQGKVVTES